MATQNVLPFQCWVNQPGMVEPNTHTGFILTAAALAMLRAGQLCCCGLNGRACMPQFEASVGGDHTLFQRNFDQDAFQESVFGDPRLEP